MEGRPGILRGRTSRLRQERGQSLVEYALILSVVAVGTIAALVVLRDDVTGIFSKAGGSLAAGGDPAGTAEASAPGADAARAGSGGVGDGAPVIALDAATLPSATTSSTTVTIRFTSSPLAASYSCTVSGAGGGTKPCTAGNEVTFTGLGTGPHTLTVTPLPTGTAATHTWQVTVSSPPANGTACTTCETESMENVSGAVYHAGGSVQRYVGDGDWSTVSGPGVYLPTIVSGISGETCSFSFPGGFTFTGTWSNTASGPGSTPGYRVGTTGAGDFYRRCS